jgi:hypothetical protein
MPLNCILAPVCYVALPAMAWLLEDSRFSLHYALDA